jgi:hypothetical protein
MKRTLFQARVKRSLCPQPLSCACISVLPITTSASPSCLALYRRRRAACLSDPRPSAVATASPAASRLLTPPSCLPPVARPPRRHALRFVPGEAAWQLASLSAAACAPPLGLLLRVAAAGGGGVEWGERGARSAQMEGQARAWSYAAALAAAAEAEEEERARVAAAAVAARGGATEDEGGDEAVASDAIADGRAARAGKRARRAQIAEMLGGAAAHADAHPPLASQDLVSPGGGGDVSVPPPLPPPPWQATPPQSESQQGSPPPPPPPPAAAAQTGELDDAFVEGDDEAEAGEEDDRWPGGLLASAPSLAVTSQPSGAAERGADGDGDGADNDGEAEGEEAGQVGRGRRGKLLMGTSKRAKRQVSRGGQPQQLLGRLGRGWTGGLSLTALWMLVPRVHVRSWRRHWRARGRRGLHGPHAARAVAPAGGGRSRLPVGPDGMQCSCCAATVPQSSLPSPVLHASRPTCCCASTLLGFSAGAGERGRGGRRREAAGSWQLCGCDTRGRSPAGMTWVRRASRPPACCSKSQKQIACLLQQIAKANRLLAAANRRPRWPCAPLSQHALDANARVPLPPRPPTALSGLR